ncbi:ANTAR domain-containing protein [Tistrella mobilis]|uniref:ANTAR domain-containing response regulator n=1 Tax=Tistrella mobilis TaxID=171437 RepID=UPI00355805E1
MSVALLRDLLGLKVLVVHPPDEEGAFLVDHLRRIGCMVTTLWPVPAELPANAEVVLLTIAVEYRAEIERLLKAMGPVPPTIIAIVGYEDPGTLQIVLESGAFAVLEKPLKPFGLLTNLAIARSLWLERQRLLKEARKLRRKMVGEQTLARAKAILMASKSLSENEAHQFIRRQAMARRAPMEEIAAAIVKTEDLLTLPRKAD